jgi:hypothetical protein
LSNIIKGSEEKLYVETKEESDSVPREIQRRPNCDADSKKLSEVRATKKLKQKDLRIITNELHCKEIEESDVANSRTVLNLEDASEQSTKELIISDTETIHQKEVQEGSKITAHSDNNNNKKVEEVEEGKRANVEEINDILGDNMNRIYLHSEMSANVLIVDYSVLDYFMKGHIDNSFVLEDPEIFHYEYLIL